LLITKSIVMLTLSGRSSLEVGRMDNLCPAAHDLRVLPDQKIFGVRCAHDGSDDAEQTVVTIACDIQFSV
jgi:hypothetical protein